MPNFPIVDTHVHLYDIHHLDYPLIRTMPGLDRSFLMSDFDEHRGPVEVEGIVFAEVAVAPGQHVDEAAWVQAIADEDSRLKGIVAHAPLEKGAAVEEDLVKLKQNAAMVGIRRLIEIEADPTFVLAPDFLDGVKLLPKHGLVFDICVKSWQMAYAIELVDRCPEVRFVLDHIGKPDIRNGLKEPWWGQIQQLAKRPNVTVKLSGVITEAKWDSWQPDDVKPYVAHVIESFGLDRVMYGSDWSVSTITHPYPQWVAIIDELLAGSTEEEQRKVFRDNAIRAYGLDMV